GRRGSAGSRRRGRRPGTVVSPTPPDVQHAIDDRLIYGARFHHSPPFAVAQPSPGDAMAETFVLITGAWHGGWTWRRVAANLRAAGHRVLAPDLPGLADGDDPRRHGLADVGDFIVDLVERHDLHDVTLVGHSWGGYPITDAAPRLAARLRRLVYWS